MVCPIIALEELSLFQTGCGKARMPIIRDMLACLDDPAQADHRKYRLFFRDSTTWWGGDKETSSNVHYLDRGQRRLVFAEAGLNLGATCSSSAVRPTGGCALPAHQLP